MLLLLLQKTRSVADSHAYIWQTLQQEAGQAPEDFKQMKVKQNGKPTWKQANPNIYIHSFQYHSQVVYKLVPPTPLHTVFTLYEVEPHFDRQNLPRSANNVFLTVSILTILQCNSISLFTAIDCSFPCFTCFLADFSKSRLCCTSVIYICQYCYLAALCAVSTLGTIMFIATKSWWGFFVHVSKYVCVRQVRWVTAHMWREVEVDSCVSPFDITPGMYPTVSACRPCFPLCWCYVRFPRRCCYTNCNNGKHTR